MARLEAVPPPRPGNGWARFSTSPISCQLVRAGGPEARPLHKPFLIRQPAWRREAFAQRTRFVTRQSAPTGEKCGLNPYSIAYC